MMTVKFLPIPGYPKYQISDDGTVRREVHPDVWIACAAIKQSTGYWAVSIINEKGKRRQQSIHRLVLLAFVGEPKKGQVACHNNGHRFDPRLSNLRWDTYIANESDKSKHGTRMHGETHHQHRLTLPEVQQIRKLSAEGILKRTDIARMFNVTPTAIYYIKKGINWKTD